MKGAGRGRGGKAMKVMKAKGKAKAGRGTEGAEGSPKKEKVARAPKGPKAMLLAMSNRDPAEVVAELKANLAKAESDIQVAVAFEESQVKQKHSAAKGLETATTAVQAVMVEEKTMIEKFRGINTKKSERGGALKDKREALIEANKKLMMLENYAETHIRLEEHKKNKQAALDAVEASKKAMAEQKAREKAALEEKKRAAFEAVEASKKAMLEQKAREKAALEATKKQLADLRAAAKGVSKRAAPAAEQAGEVGNID